MDEEFRSCKAVSVPGTYGAGLYGRCGRPLCPGSQDRGFVAASVTTDIAVDLARAVVAVTIEVLFDSLE